MFGHSVRFFGHSVRFLVTQLGRPIWSHNWAALCPTYFPPSNLIIMSHVTNTHTNKQIYRQTDKQTNRH